MAPGEIEFPLASVAFNVPYVNASGEIVPTEFYNINVTDTSGNTYAIQNC